MSRTYPFFIEIENLKAPVKKGETGQLQMVLSDSRDQKKSIYWFTLQEGLSWIAEMEKKVEQYEICSFSKQHRLVEEAIAAARNSAKNS